MGFWFKNIFFAIFLIGLAYTFFANQDLLLSLNSATEKEASTKVTVYKGATSKAPLTSSTTKKPQYQQANKPDNAAADGLSNFYAKIYGDGTGEAGPKTRNNIIYLPDPQGNLVDIIKNREMLVSPYRESWQGSTASRPFRKGNTLFKKFAEYAEQDGLKVVWWLNKDFIVKDVFRIEKSIIKTAYQIGTAVSGHFPEGISSYFCYRQRTLVFINEAPQFLKDECTLLKSQNAY